MKELTKVKKFIFIILMSLIGQKSCVGEIPVCSEYFDLTFILCARNSDEWDRVKQIAVGVVKNSDIGFRKTRVSVITYFDGPKLVLRFSENPSVIVSTINDISHDYFVYKRDIISGLKEMTTMYDTDQGQNPNIVIIFADEISDDDKGDITETIKLAYIDNIMIIPISFDAEDELFISEISSPPKRLAELDRFKDRNYFILNTSEHSSVYITQISQSLCNIKYHDCLSTPFNFAILVDISYSLCENSNIQNQITNFLTKLIHEVDSHAIVKKYFSIAAFAETTEILINFTTDIKNVIKTIDNLPCSKNETLIYQSINTLKDDIYSDKHEYHKKGRNYAILITDAIQDSLHREEMYIREAKEDKDITVIPIGITNSDESSKMIIQLKRISLSPHRENENYFIVDNINQLNGKIKSILDAMECYKLIPPETTTPTPVTGCESTFTTFIIDASRSIGPETFQLNKEKLKELILEMKYFENMALIVFSDVSSIIFNHNTHFTQDAILTELNSVTYHGGHTRTFFALEDAIDDLHKKIKPLLSGYPHVVVTITDGVSDNIFKTSEQAILATNMDIHLISINTKNEHGEYELNSLASYPQINNYFINWNHNDWNHEILSKNYKHQLKNLICNNINECLNNNCVHGACVNKIGGYICFCEDRYGGENCDIVYSETIEQVLISIDVSGSTKQKDFDKLKIYIHELILKLPGQTKIALQSYSNSAEFHVEFTHDKYKLLSVLSSIIYVGGRTNLTHAFQLAKETFDFEIGVSQVMVIFSDAQVDDEAEAFAATLILKQNNVNIVGFGFEISKMEFFPSMFSHPFKNNYITLQDYDDVLNLVKLQDVANLISNTENRCHTNICKNNSACTKTFNHYTCECAGQYSGNKCDGCYNENFDIVIVLDASGSIAHDNFAELKLMIVDYVRQLPMRNTNIGLVSFSDISFRQFDINQFSESLEIMYGILLTNYIGGRSNLASGLDEANKMFSNINNDRKKVLLLATDGNGNIRQDETLGITNSMRKSGIQIIALGTGFNVNKHMMHVAASHPYTYSIPISENYMYTYDQLMSIVSASCNYEKNCPNNCNFSGNCSTRFGLHSCQCNSNYVGKYCDTQCSGRPVDVVLIIDYTSGVEEYYNVVETISNKIIYGLNYQKNYKLAMVMFGEKADVIFDFNEYSKPQDMIEFLRIPDYEEGSDSYRAFKLVNDELINFPSLNKRVIIFMTNIKSSNKIDFVVSESDKSKLLGAEIFTFGIGSYYDRDELKAIASIDDDLHVNVLVDYSIESANKLSLDILNNFC